MPPVDSPANEQDHRPLEDIQADLDKARAQQHAWGQSIDKHTVELMTVRTASYNPETVQQARSLNINPDNFETEAELEQAIEIVNKQNSEETN